MENWSGKDITPEIWEKVKPLFEAASDMDAEQRSAFLSQNCPDHRVREEVEKLLANHDKAGDFLLDPAVGGLATPSVGSHLPTLTPGTLLAGRFKVVRFVAVGGMGEVYEAEDLELREYLGIKTLRPELLQQPNAIERFKREVHLARKVTHPNVCRVFDLVRDKSNKGEDLVFVTMEFLRGETLADRLKRESRMSIEESFGLITQMASALDAAHQAGIVHRDFKPGNVVLVDEPAGLRAVVTDFGLAFRGKLASAEQLTTASWHQISAPGELYGTPAYMAPEQVEGRPATAASDIYALGLVIYEMVTGVRPFAGDTPMSVAAKRLVEPPVSPRKFNPTLSAVWECVILRCLNRDPDKRFATPRDVAKALAGDAPKQSVADLQLLKRYTDSYKSTAASERTPALRNGRVLWIIGAVALLVAAFLGGYPLLRRPVKLTEKDTIVLAKFVNNTGDPVFDDALQQALAVDLGQSPFLKILSDARVRETLRQMTHSPNEPLTKDLTREVCQRAGGKSYLAGSIATLGTQYVISLDALSCESGDTLAREQVTADGEERVLPALGQAAAKLRNELGESLSSVQKFDVPLVHATTDSLEALKAHSVALRIGNEKGDAEAIPFEKHAIELDPRFAEAYGALGVNYYNLNQPSQAADCFRKAFDLRNRATEREGFYITALYYESATGELEKASQNYQLWIQTYPRDSWPHGELGSDYMALGQYEKAEAEIREGLRLEQISWTQYANLGFIYLALNRFDDSRAVVEDALRRKLDGVGLHLDLYDLAFLRGNLAAMKQQADWAMGKSGAEDQVLSLESDTEAWSGKLSRARELSRQAVESARRNNDEKEAAALWQANAAIREALFKNARGGRENAAAAIAIAPRSRDAEAQAALAYSFSGDTAHAQSLVDELAKRFPQDTIIQRVWLPTIHSQIEMARNNSDHSIELLRAVAPYELGMLTGSAINSCLYPVYVRAEAYLKKQQGADAAAEFQKLLNHRGLLWNCATGPLAQLGLARAYALEGRTSESRAAYQGFLDLWKNADPDIPILKQAKFEYEKLQ
ncbi:MAG: protein kinase [Candidatus Sulfotelmatobacter sp.]